MTKKLGITLGIVCSAIFLIIAVAMSYININDTANTKLQEIKGFKPKVEASLDEMNKTIAQLAQATKGEKQAFLEFQALVSDSKKGQSVGGMMSQIQEKYPTFDIKGFNKLMEAIEVKRDEFTDIQNAYNDRIAQYNSYVVTIIHKMFLSGNHTPLEQFVVSSTKAKASMQTGKDELDSLKF